jgi:hypothetical protein
VNLWLKERTYTQLFWKRRQGLLKTLFSLNLGCLVWGGAIVKNSQYHQNRQKSTYFDLLTRLPQAKGHPFYFLFWNTHIKSFSKNTLLWYNITYFCTNIRPTAPRGHGCPTGPLASNFLNFLLFSIKNYINCKNFIKKYDKLTFLLKFLFFRPLI